MSTRRLTTLGVDVEVQPDHYRRVTAVGANVEEQTLRTRKLSALALMIETTPLLPPVADFSGTPLVGDEPLTVIFTDLSINTATAWAWDFGDGGVANTRNPNHTYAVDGLYTVSLTVSNYNGSSNETKVDYVRVNIFVPAPVVRIMHFTGIDTPDKPNQS